MAAAAARCAMSFRCFTTAAAGLRPLHTPLSGRAAAGAAAAAGARMRSYFPRISSCAAAARASAAAGGSGGTAASYSAARGEAAAGLACSSQGGTPSLSAATAVKVSGAAAAAGAAAPSTAPSSASALSCGAALLLRRSFSAAAAAARDSSSPSNRLLLTLSSPSEAIYVKTPVHSVTVPGSEGAMTLTNGHSQMVARLKAGEIIVRREGVAGSGAGGSGGDAAADRYFVSDGFLLFSGPEDDSGCCTAEVLGIELVPVHVLDKEKAVAALQTLLQQGAGAADEWTKARTLLGQELLSSVIRVAS